MKTVRLDDPRTLPERLLKRLAPHEPLIRRSGFIEHLLQDRGFKSVATEVDEFVANGTVRAYHCTRELKPGTFQRQRLRLLDSKQHIAEFMGARAGSVMNGLSRRSARVSVTPRFVIADGSYRFAAGVWLHHEPAGGAWR